jgi:ATP-binding cassette subfamily B protein
VLGLLGAIAFSEQRLLAELTSRYAQDQVLDVTCAVELSTFDEPQFFDRLARAQAGISRVPTLIFGLAGLLRSISGSVGAFAALIAIQPLVAPLVLVTVVPAVLAAAQRGRLFYSFSFGMTPRDRERRYLAGLLTERDAAKEVRAYNLARFLRARHDRLYDEHIAELRTTARRSLIRGGRPRRDRGDARAPAGWDGHHARGTVPRRRRYFGGPMAAGRAGARVLSRCLVRGPGRADRGARRQG